MTKKELQEKDYDLICVGGGIMSATLALMLKILDPELRIIILERLDKVAQESSEAWNNAGTGHSALCELNYTPQLEDGSIDTTKAIKIFEQFEKSKQFWSFLVEEGYIKDPASYIQSVPHHSWVRGKDDVEFLRKRFEALKNTPMFDSMQYTEDFETMREWFPIIMNGRSKDDDLAATRMEIGTEVNFGKLTQLYFEILEKEFDVPVLRGIEVQDVDPDRELEWTLQAKNVETGETLHYDAYHIFIGAGGGAIPLLQKVDIQEKEGYGGFPVSGQWLVCNNREIIEKHHAKVYSKAGPDAPPMSTPHLDTRYIKGKKELLFGPFAGFTTKFLKEGSKLDLPKSIKLDNLPSMWGVFWHNLPLTQYLMKQATMTHKDRIEDLRKFIKDAKPEDWQLQAAGKRVQIIRRDEDEGGALEFGTDIVHSSDGTISALLGASPGASVAVEIMINVIRIAFKDRIETNEWQQKLDKMIPLWNRDIIGNEEEFLKLQEKCSNMLNLNAVH